MSDLPDDEPEADLEDDLEDELDDELADEKRDALAILDGIVSGEAMLEDSVAALEQADPTLVYFIFKWIEKFYNRDHDEYEFVRARLSGVKNANRSLTRKAKEGELDPVVEWFEGSHRYSETDAVTFIDLVIEKLEG